jgi:5-methyltetrahydrofolate--homocysteine methyltransferase
MASFLDLLAERPVLLADGATGTNYQNMGIEPGVAPEEWVIDEPEQVRALADGGVDLLVLETFFSLDEGLWALEGITGASDLPLVVSYSFDQGTKTMMGLTPTQVVEAFAPLGVAAIGANRGKSLDDTDRIVEELLAVADGLPLWVKPNAGVPRMVRDAVIYDAGPDDLARHVAGYAAGGARIVGGCCGSTPEHIAAIARELSARDMTGV